MKAFVKQVLIDEGDNYILPFFWQHGEPEEVIREYMAAIFNCGIRAVCIEARPHPDFCGPGWWHDIDIILDEAKKRDMKIWILDDAHFPTGYANGILKNADAKLCKQYLAVNQMEICGPVSQVSLDVDYSMKSDPMPRGEAFQAKEEPRQFDDDELVGVLAAEVTERDTISDRVQDLTHLVTNGWLYWDVPDGMWRVFVIYKTRNGGGRLHYINMVDEASCRMQIEAVYEPHYAHYKEEFGKTIAGFFSDEPSIGNIRGFSFDESIGRKWMLLPWSDAVQKQFSDCLGADYPGKLPALWMQMTDAELTGQIRYHYMDVVTQLIRDNFSRQLGHWCEEHGVEYIGHIVEDSNQHSRLGSSQGHFFRSMDGQHMAGIDDIGNQVIKGGAYTRRLSRPGRVSEGEFFHYELGKLGSSHAHIDPKKQGRAMCEIFGAYGWNEGVRLMKYLVDHFLVRGINYYVPHAFSPKTFPDMDCPPHFYAHGENPQYRHFGYLMRYLNRMCHLLNHGRAVVQAAVLYHGEAEWSGKCMFDQRVSRHLMDHQIDFDILPADIFTERETFGTSFNGQLYVNGNHYKALIVPYSQYIPKEVANFAIEAQKEGFPVIFIQDYPTGILGVRQKNTQKQLLDKLSCCNCVALDKLAAFLKEKAIGEIKLSEPAAHIHYYHYVQDNTDIFLLLNESPWEVYDGTVQLPVTGSVYEYDGMQNQVYAVNCNQNNDSTTIDLFMQPLETRVIIFDTPDRELAEKPECKGQVQSINGPWSVAVCESKEYPNFKWVTDMQTLDDFGKVLPDFSGFIRYETTFDAKPGKAVLCFQDAYEGVEVWVNGQYAGMQICSPYEFDIGGLLKPGKNSLTVEVATTLYRKVKKLGKTHNFFGPQASILEPLGLVGNVSLYIN